MGHGYHSYVTNCSWLIQNSSCGGKSMSCHFVDGKNPVCSTILNVDCKISCKINFWMLNKNPSRW